MRFIILPLLAGIYLFIGKFVAGIVVDFTQGTLMGLWYYNFITGYLSQFMDADMLIASLIFGEYGVLTMVPIYLLGLLLPLVASFYLVLHLLLDSGLMNRIAYSTSNFFRYFGLSGEAVIPLMLGFGCVTAALISVNSLPSKREQLIASILLSLTIPCSAQFAIIIAFSTILSPEFFLLYSLVMLMVFVAGGLLLNKLITGKTVISKPFYGPLSLPPLLSVINKTIKASRLFLKDAAPTFALGGVMMALLNYSGGFVKIHNWWSPLTSGLLKLPARATDLFVLAIIKKDLAAAEFYFTISQGGFSQAQITIILIVMTLFVPCFASFMILLKDRGAIVALSTWFGSFILSFSLGGIISNLLM